MTVVGAVRIYYGFKVTFDDDVPCRSNAYNPLDRIHASRSDEYLRANLHCQGVNADLMNWTAVECCVGTVCASLPPMAPLLKRSPQSSTRHMSKIWANVSLPRFRWPLWGSYQSRSQFKDSQEEEDSTILRDLRASDRKSPANYYSRAVPNEWAV